MLCFYHYNLDLILAHVQVEAEMRINNKNIEVEIIRKKLEVEISIIEKRKEQKIELIKNEQAQLKEKSERKKAAIKIEPEIKDRKTLRKLKRCFCCGFCSDDYPMVEPGVHYYPTAERGAECQGLFAAIRDYGRASIISLEKDYGNVA